MARRPTPRPAVAPQPTARELLFGTWPGRLFLISAAVKLVVALWRVTGALPSVARVTSSAATIGLGVAVGVFAWRLFVQIKRRLLWRVRRKLILSYIFIGVIPALLILIFFLFAGSLVFMNVSAYLFKDGYDAIIEHARISAQAAATEIGRDPSTAGETIQRVHRIRASLYPDMSVAYLPPAGERITAGRSAGLPVKDSAGEEELIVRAFVKVGTGGSDGAVVVDIPLDDQVTQRLHESTGVRIENVFDSRVETGNRARSDGTSARSSRSVVFEKSLAQIDVQDWATGMPHSDTIALSYKLGELYRHLSSAQNLYVSGNMRLSEALLLVLIVIGVMFLIIEAVALVMGLALARSITSSVHELFTGTERVQQGDFTHRINIESRDQLGE